MPGSTPRRLAVLVFFGSFILAAPTTALAAAGSQLWASRYASAAGGTDSGISVAVSPDGSKVFVTGYSKGSGTKVDYLTIAYNASTGVRIWGKRYDGPAHRNDYPHGIAVSASGGTVFVTGESQGSNGLLQWATVAYNAANGAQRWVERYAPSTKFNHQATAIAIKGSRLFVTGNSGASTTSGGAYDIVTIGYSAATGSRLWANRYKHTANDGVTPTALAVSADGTRVFATGNDAFINGAFYTIAYDAATGVRRWVRRDPIGDYSHAIGVAPDGSRVYVAGGGSDDAIPAVGYYTVAYSASTGSPVWSKLLDGTGEALGLAVSPDGAKVVVTGQSPFTDFCGIAQTVAYAASNGAQQWSKTYTPPQPTTGCAGSTGSAIAVSHDSAQVFITGWDEGSATIAYAASNGTQQWAKSYQKAGGNALVVSPTNLRLYVTGGYSFSGHIDMGTIAYQAR
jgi:DNA-binding beta-propeller fold protein YncE